MKRTIEWHEQCLKNMRDNYAREKAALYRHEQEVERRLEDIYKLERQLVAAKKLKRDGFDSEKFMKRDAQSAAGDADNLTKEKT